MKIQEFKVRLCFNNKFNQLQHFCKPQHSSFTTLDIFDLEYLIRNNHIVSSDLFLHSICEQLFSISPLGLTILQCGVSRTAIITHSLNFTIIPMFMPNIPFSWNLVYSNNQLNCLPLLMHNHNCFDQIKSKLLSTFKSIRNQNCIHDNP
jgi:hypothetical protein